MIKRPRSVTNISWIFIVIGCSALVRSLQPSDNAAVVYAIAEFRAKHPFMFAVTYYVGPILTLVSGVFMLRGCDWARWLLVVWLGYTVIDSALHWPLRLLPGLLFGVAVFFLFRPQATAFFRGTSAKPPQIPNPDETPKA